MANNTKKKIDSWSPQLIQRVSEEVEASNEGDLVDIEFGGTRIRFRPKKVTVDEVSAYARRSCTTCSGDGKLSLTLPSNQHVIGTCGCAAKRYQRLVPMLKDTKTGNWISLTDLVEE